MSAATRVKVDQWSLESVMIEDDAGGIWAYGNREQMQGIAIHVSVKRRGKEFIPSLVRDPSGDVLFRQNRPASPSRSAYRLMGSLVGPSLSGPLQFHLTGRSKK